MAVTYVKKPQKESRPGALANVSPPVGTYQSFRGPVAKGKKILLGSFRGMDGLKLHDLVMKGMRTAELKAMVDQYRVLDKSAIYGVLGVSERTMQRHSGGTVSSVVSAAAVDLASITEQAAEVLGSMEEAERWLAQPAVAFKGRRPIDLVVTRQGADVVRNHLIRMDYGVYA